MPLSTLSKLTSKANPKFFPVWEIVLLLFVFPPIAWFYMWKHRSYHLWLVNSLYIYSIATFGVGLYLFFFDFQSLREIYRMLGIADGLTTEQVLISLPILLSLSLLILALHLKSKLKKQGKLTESQLTMTMVIIVLYSMIIPLAYTIYSFFAKEQLPIGLEGILSKL